MAIKPKTCYFKYCIIHYKNNKVWLKMITRVSSFFKENWMIHLSLKCFKLDLWDLMNILLNFVKIVMQKLVLCIFKTKWFIYFSSKRRGSEAKILKILHIIKERFQLSSDLPFLFYFIITENVISMANSF